MPQGAEEIKQTLLCCSLTEVQGGLAAGDEDFTPDVLTWKKRWGRAKWQAAGLRARAVSVGTGAVPTACHGQAPTARKQFLPASASLK